MGGLWCCNSSTATDVDDQNRPYTKTNSAGSDKQKEKMPSSYTERPIANVRFVAIDIGNKYSGYAFDYADKPNIFTNKLWFDNENKSSTLKAPSCLLMHQTEESFDFGYAALTKYTRYPGIPEDHNLFYSFKNELVSEKITDILAVNKNKIPKSHLLTEMFRYFVGQLEDQLGKKLNCKDISLVIPVKQELSADVLNMLKDAAKKVKLHTVLCPTEHEAAALFCQNYDLRKLAKGDSTDCFVEMGSGYVIIDFGENISITVHRKTDKYHCELVEGKPVIIDSTFEATLFGKISNVFPDGLMESYQKKYPKQWMEMMITFEDQKRKYTKTDCTKINVKCCETFTDHVKDQTGKTVQEYLAKYGDVDIIWQAGNFEIEFTKQFQTIINTLNDNLEQICQNNNCVKYIFIVGGLSSALIKPISAKFKGRKIVIEPIEASASVVKGAIMYAREHMNTESWADEKSRARIDKKSRAKNDETSNAGINETSSATIDEESSPLIIKTPSASIDEKPKAMIDEKPRAGIDEPSRARDNETSSAGFAETSRAKVDGKSNPGINETSSEGTDGTSIAKNDETSNVGIIDTTSAASHDKSKACIDEMSMAGLQDESTSL